MNAAARPNVTAVALGAIAFAASIPFFYALLRLVQALLFAEPDPRTILYSEHAGFYWRTLTAGYLAGMAAILVTLAARRRPHAVASALARIVPIVAILAAAQGLLLP